MNKNAFVAYVFGSYEKYIPYYIYFININYPDDEVLIFHRNTLSKNVEDALVELNNYKLFNNVLPNNEDIKNGGGGKKHRWILPKKYILKYDNIYIGDVDILILKENESLFAFHENQAQKFNLPFSNKVRKLTDGSVSKRLTGLHFIKVVPYYKKMESKINELLNDKIAFKSYLEGVVRDEHFLYKLVKDCIGFDENEVSKMERPWHGFHVGVVRGGLKMSKTQIEENSSISFNDIKEQLTAVLIDPKFTHIFKASFCIEIYWSYLQFGIKIPFKIKKQYWFYLINRFIKKIRNKIIK